MGTSKRFVAALLRGLFPLGTSSMWAIDISCLGSRDCRERDVWTGFGGPIQQRRWVQERKVVKECQCIESESDRTSLRA